MDVDLLSGDDGDCMSVSGANHLTNPSQLPGMKVFYFTSEFLKLNSKTALFRFLKSFYLDLDLEIN